MLNSKKKHHEKNTDNSIPCNYLLAGCSEDFLNRYPTTYQVIESFYKTPADGEQALAAAYKLLTA